MKTKRAEAGSPSDTTEGAGTTGGAAGVHKPPKMGRPIRKPESRRKVFPDELLWPDMVAILRKCKAPEHWGPEHAMDLWWYVTRPSGYLAYCERHRRGEVRPPRAFGEHAAARIKRSMLLHLLNFDAMFAEAPDAVAKAIPLLRKLWGKRFASTLFSPMAELAMAEDGVAWGELTEDQIAEYLKRRTGAPVTTDVVRKARRKLREVLRK